jgi:glycosyltransferase involved in cell wall biosynthesis
MTYDLIFPALPPALNGIGDYTAHLATELARTHEVRVLTAQADALDLRGAGVAVERAFTTGRRGAVHALVGPIAARRPDWVLLQYNPFSYGEWGLNLSLPAALGRIRAAAPSTRIALTVHEPFVPVRSLRSLVMTTWQRLQFWRLGRQADVVFCAIEPWVERFTPWFPATRVAHLPVGSNMPRVEAARTTVRGALGFGPETLVLGLFGQGHPSRMLSFVRRAIGGLRAEGRDARVLYVGPAVDVVAGALSGVPHHCTGALPGPDVSRHFAAMDLYLAPFRDGVSARRGSFLAGLQHGLATVSTTGPQTDAFLNARDGTAFLLAPDDDLAAYEAHVWSLVEDAALRARLAAGGQALYDEVFAWPRIADRMLSVLASVPAPSSPLAPAAR